MPAGIHLQVNTRLPAGKYHITMCIVMVVIDGTAITKMS